MKFVFEVALGVVAGVGVLAGVVLVCLELWINKQQRDGDNPFE